MKRIWVFDFDGTLSQLVENRNDAVMVPGARALLEALADNPHHLVAILSSRTLEDLQRRAEVGGVYLGGSCGLFWRTPKGDLVSLNPGVAEGIQARRRVVLPLLTELLRPHDIDLEDKGATITIHYRTVPAIEQPLLRRLVQAFCLNRRMAYFEGPFALEIRLHESIKKREGLMAMLKTLGDGALPEEVFYAGDDENDADAMQWLVSRGGTAVTVGGRIEVAGATGVANPHELLEVVRARHQLAFN